MPREQMSDTNPYDVLTSSLLSMDATYGDIHDNTDRESLLRSISSLHGQSSGHRKTKEMKRMNNEADSNENQLPFSLSFVPVPPAVSRIVGGTTAPKN
eukprot:13246643-Ditylum_brightwellii.AAC.1